jgi:CDP-diacylglycerol--glycerol-3-phosphate 3-phosphatidyltransferase
MKSKKREEAKAAEQTAQREELKNQLKEELRKELIEDLKKEEEAEEKTAEIIEEQPVSVQNKMNLPNKLTVFRIILVPVVMIFIYIESDYWSKIIAALLFLTASLTDLADGIIARKHNLVTNFGKLMDPLADKFLVVGSLIAITASVNFETMRFLSVWVTAGVFFRELAITSVRLVATNSDGNVIAAGFLGKIKTAAQCVCILTVLLEDIIITRLFDTPENMFSYITMSVMLAVTVYSGFDYLRTYWKYIDPAN